jgi:hypothetical protein
VKAFFNEVPLVGQVIMGRRPEAFTVKHRVRSSPDSVYRWSVKQLAQIVHHLMRAMLPKLLGVAFARDAAHKPEVPLAPGLDPSDSILDDDRSCGSTPSRFAAIRNVSGAGFPARCCARMVLPSTRPPRSGHLHLAQMVRHP